MEIEANRETNKRTTTKKWMDDINKEMENRELKPKDWNVKRSGVYDVRNGKHSF